MLLLGDMVARQNGVRAVSQVLGIPRKPLRAEAFELVMPPMLEKTPRLRADLPLTGVQWGEAVKAVVVLKPGEQASEVRTLREPYCRKEDRQVRVTFSVMIHAAGNHSGLSAPV